jgi:hypothetical protein
MLYINTYLLVFGNIVAPKDSTKPTPLPNPGKFPSTTKPLQMPTLDTSSKLNCEEGNDDSEEEDQDNEKDEATTRNVNARLMDSHRAHKQYV